MKPGNEEMFWVGWGSTHRVLIPRGALPMAPGRGCKVSCATSAQDPACVFSVLGPFLTVEG